MPRAERLSPERVVEEAALLADENGFSAVGILELARRLGVKAPSLYNHVGSLDEVRRALRLQGTRMLGAWLADAAVGRSGDEGLRALATAWRDFARAHPGLYAAAQAAPPRDDHEGLAAAAATVGIVSRLLESPARQGDELIHAVRTLRSALHGFIALELEGGFGLAVDLDRSWDELVDTVLAGLRRRKRL